MSAAEMSFAGWRFDGATAAKEEMSLHIQPGQGIWQVRQDGPIVRLDAQTLQLTEPFGHAPLLVNCADGSHLELSPAKEAHAALLQAGASPSASNGLVASLARDWRMAVLTLAFLASVVAAFYVWLLPSLAATVVPMVPSSWKAAIGDSAMTQLDATLFTPSTLPEAKREQIQKSFNALVEGEKVDYKLHLRHFRQGPNAIALPGNHIVLTDELVELVDGDVDVVIGVLAHELGHIKHDHGLRMVIQASALYVLGSALIGDYSSILAAAPAVLGRLQYSREFETEADRHSHQLLCAKGQDASKTAVFFEKIREKYKLEGDIPLFLRSHPDSVNRAQFFKSKC